MAYILLFSVDLSALDKEEKDKDKVLRYILAWRKIRPISKLYNIFFLDI